MGRLARSEFIEDRCLKELDSVLAEMEELERLRRLIALLTVGHTSDTQPRVATFLRWSGEHLAKVEVSLTLEALDHRFIDNQIFGDSDGKGFYPRGW